MSSTLKEPKAHLGRNIKRLREMVGMKQEVAAERCGWSQQKMSKLEQSEDIDEVDLITIVTATKPPFI